MSVRDGVAVRRSMWRMTPIVMQVVAVIAVSTAAIAYGAYVSRSRPGASPPMSYTDATAYRVAITGLPEDSKAAETFAANAAALFKNYSDSVQALDGKIGTVLGYVGGGTSVLALLGGSGKVERPTFTPLLVLALLALAFVFYCALEGLRPQSRASPNVAELCDLALLRSMSGNTRMQALMGWEYLESTRNTVPILLAKAGWLKRCYQAFAVGVIAVVLNAVLPSSETQPHVKTVPFTCTSALNTILHCDIDVTEALR